MGGAYLGSAFRTPVSFVAERHALLTEIRRDLHAHPELGFEEHRTAALVAERLHQWGIEVHTGVGRTGVVGIIPAAGRVPASRSDCAPTWTRCRLPRKTSSATAPSRAA
jgi:hypothetical protein